MNTWLIAQLPVVLNLMAQVTVLLAVGLVLQQSVRRSLATRHAILLWTLIAVGFCPVVTTVLRLIAVPIPTVIRTAAQPFHVLFGDPAAALTIHSIAQPQTTHPGFFIGIALALWAAGTLLSSLWVVCGLLVAMRIKRSACPIAPEKIAGLRPQLLHIFGHNLP